MVPSLELVNNITFSYTELHNPNNDAAVVKWQVECTGLWESGTAIKDLPKKPKWVLKQSLVEGEASESEETDKSGSDSE
jgi:hypothetical protein